MSKELLFGILIISLLFAGCARPTETPTPTGPEAIAEAFIQAFSDGDIDTCLNLVSDNVVFRQDPPGVSTEGKVQFDAGLREGMAQQHPQFSITSPMRVGGDKVTFSATMSSDDLRILGIDYINSNHELLICDGKITSWLIIPSPEDWERIIEFTAGGVGFKVEFVEQGIRVKEFAENSPAYEAGVRVGDVIIAVDGVSCSQMRKDEALLRLKGPLGSKVLLRVIRENVPTPIDIEVTRVDLSQLHYPYESLGYFPITEGHGIKYHVTDDWNALECDVWAVSQYFETGRPDKLAFVFTLTKEGTRGGYFRNSSLGGDASLNIDARDLTLFVMGWPVGNQANFYFSFSLPRTFSPGDEWTIRDKKYRVEYVGPQTVNKIEFKDCIKVTIDDSLNKNEYLKGNGYFILARDIGIVKLVFNRTNGKNVLYEYVEHKQLTKHTISGTISDRGRPTEGIIVQISNANCGIRSVTNSNGVFSIQAYGPDVVLRIGYDKDNNDALEYDRPNYPKEYCVSSVISDVTDLSVDISTL